MSELNRLVTMAQALVSARAALEKADAAAKAAKALVTRLEQEDIPELMRELGVASFALADGSKLSLTEDIQCGITEARRAEAHAWLTANGFGGLIKTKVVVQFGREERDAALACAASVGGVLEESVHPQTLKSFLKERRAAGDSPPEELFGIHPFSRVKVE
jgi:hypothetical protein